MGAMQHALVIEILCAAKNGYRCECTNSLDQPGWTPREDSLPVMAVPMAYADALLGSQTMSGVKIAGFALMITATGAALAERALAADPARGRPPQPGEVIDQ